MVFWMPQLIKAISSGYSNTTVGLLVMIPYLVALPVMTLVGRSSDRRCERRCHTAIPLMIGAISLGLLGTTASSVSFSVTLWCLVASGVYSLFGPFLSLPNEFLAGFSAAAGIALINSIGNLGGFVGPYAMGASSKTTGKLSRRPCLCRDFIVHVGDAGTRVTEKNGTARDERADDGAAEITACPFWSLTSYGDSSLATLGRMTAHTEVIGQFPDCRLLAQNCCARWVPTRGESQANPAVEAG